MEQQAKELINLVNRAQRIVITAHKSPDGDSVGSSTALFQFLKNRGKEVHICHPDPAPKFLNFMKGADQIKNYEESPEAVGALLEQSDLIFMLDYNHSSRTGAEMGKIMEASSAKKVMIDHHLNPSDQADLTISDTTASSTCQLIYQFIVASGNHAEIDKDLACSVYVGLVTDTGSFRFNSVKPETHEIAADLIRIGVQQDRIHEALYDVNTLDRIRLRSYLCAEKLEVIEGGKVAYITVTKDEMLRYNYEKGDTEGLVNVALSIGGVVIAALFSEADHGVKISFRSKGKDHPVNVLASDHFGGGGHANAAGGFHEGTIGETVNRFKEVLKSYV
ncbi:MAG: bifunctional oligoribonuclease/PAP phosphatase NrnA [Bacteroidetes bacterium]|nr:MAG: bifunctional oligoribonuclease/PAP phosphatase NrnA [Bacteroidota bacterium]